MIINPYAQAEVAYRGAQIRQEFGGASRKRTRIPFVGRTTGADRRAR